MKCDKGEKFLFHEQTISIIISVSKVDKFKNINKSEKLLIASERKFCRSAMHTFNYEVIIRFSVETPIVKKKSEISVETSKVSQTYKYIILCNIVMSI